MMESPQWKPFHSSNNNDNPTNALNYERSPSPYSSSYSFVKSDSSKYDSSLLIGNFQLNNNYNSGASSSNELSNSNRGASFDCREAGIVEKLMRTYGFIQCCERQARLFFHFSQFNGNPDHLKVGDAVDFELTYDKRTGKPIARLVAKIGSEAFKGEELSLERVSGFITTEVTNEREGRVAYENRGECFFLPFTKEDLEDSDLVLKSNDRVTFHLANDKIGNLRARRICLESPTPDIFKGVVCTIKDSYGFIERVDIVKEIFFHSSECKDFENLKQGDDVEFSIQTRKNKDVAVNVTRLPPGTVVFEDISKETHFGRIDATAERHNTHLFARQYFYLCRLDPSNNPLKYELFPGKINVINCNSEIVIPFDERDVRGNFTLQVGDYVHFNIAIDRRDKLKRATSIRLSEETFKKSGEHREQGYIAALKESYGFIKCLNREGTRIYFKMSEMIDPDICLKLNEEVEFTIASDSSMPGRLQAIRIQLVPNGTLFKNLLSKPISHFTESIQNENSSKLNSFKYESSNCDLIDLNTDAKGSTHEFESTSNSESSCFIPNHNSWSQILSQLPISMNSGLINGTNADKPLIDLFSSSDCDKNPVLKPLDASSLIGNSGPVLINDKAQEDFEFNNFNELELKSSNRNNVDTNYNSLSTFTFNGGGVNSTGVNNSSIHNGAPVQKGYIAALKESYGFIENENHQYEVFFHYSVFEGDISKLDLGQEVEYTVTIKNLKPNAEFVRRINTGTLTTEEVEEEELNGKIVRSVRCLNPEQDDYCGLVQVIEPESEEETEKCEGQIYEFSITSLANIHEYVQKGDLVVFQLGFSKELGYKRAVNIKPIRRKYQATVDSIKGNFGFLNYEIEEGKKLFFHMSEVKSENINLNPRDIVEFAIVHNQRSGKYSACSVVKQSDAVNEPRPERLISKIKSLIVDGISSGPKMVLVRQPKGPDGSKGFIIPRQVDSEAN